MSKTEQEIKDEIDFENWWQDERYDEKLKNYQGLIFNRIKHNMRKAFVAGKSKGQEVKS